MVQVTSLTLPEPLFSLFLFCRSHTIHTHLMGKKWRGGSGKVGGAHVGGANDVSSLKGKGCILATCEGARVKETNKELCNLVTQAIEELYSDLGEVVDDGEADITAMAGISSDRTNSGFEPPDSCL